MAPNNQRVKEIIREIRNHLYMCKTENIMIQIEDVEVVFRAKFKVTKIPLRKNPSNLQKKATKRSAN